MSFSIQRAVSDGTMTLLPVSIEYLDREEISVLFDGILNARQWAWVGTTDKTLSFTPPVANTVEVTVVRSTDLSELRHQFSLGAQFTAESLDESLLQVLHIAQEATERQLGGDFFTDINMHGLQITNLGAATAPDHAVTLAQYQADASGASAAKDTAVASASTAVAASNSASASASAALTSANNADTSEFNALSSKNSAATSASTASTKAAEAAASAAAALVSENASELAESNAKASEVAAAASAASALHPWEAEVGGIHYDLGNVRIGGVGKRITADFSSAVANRVMFQTSTVNGNTNLSAIPNGAGTQANIRAYNNSDPANSAIMSILSTPGDCRVEAATSGTGAYLPMTFYTGGAERMRIDTSGKVGVSMAPVPADGARLQVQQLQSTYSPATDTYARVQVVAHDYTSLPSWSNLGMQYYGKTAVGNIDYLAGVPKANAAILESINTSVLGIITNSAPIILGTAGIERMRIDTSGNVGVGIVPQTTGLGLNASTASTTQLSGYASTTYIYGVGRNASNGAEIDSYGDITFRSNSTTGARTGTERFRIGTSGQLGIAGANYGTAGQVLTSGGPSAAPTWSNAGGFGVSQTWQDVTASRAAATDYTNSTGNPIMLSVAYMLNTGSAMTIMVGGVEVAYAQGENAAGIKRSLQLVVPNGVVYRINTVGSPALQYWKELR